MKKYTGKKLENKIEGIDIQPYLPDDYLVEAVNLALLLKRPLLLMGEPGCGKTRLAEAVAYELYEKDYKEHYVEWRIKSTTKAQEGLYRYDALRKLYDIQQGASKKNQINNNKLGQKDSYFQRGELAESFHKSKKDLPCVLLIDEIDKADIDFPNDLLNELDKYSFKIVETGQEIEASDEKPLVIITSNKEKELPAAFLRRCIYYFIEFPNEKRLQEIVEANYGKTEQTLQEKAIYTFHYLRQMTGHAEKTLSTSELLDWVKALIEYAQNDDFKDTIEEWIEGWENTDHNREEELDKMKEKIKSIPYAQVLFKDEKTWKEFKNLMPNKNTKR